MSKTRQAAIVALLLLLLCIDVYALIQEWRIQSTGEVKTVGIMAYVDADCTTEMNAINWGNLYPGSTRSVTCYLKNSGDCSETLLIWTENWLPVNAADYLTCTWDYSGQSIQAGEVVPVTFTLNVSRNVTSISRFSFDIWILAEHS